MAAHQAPLSLGFSRQEYWSGLPFPSPMHACLLSWSLTLCNPMDSSPPGSSVHRILWARILEWVAISFSNACVLAKLLQSSPTLSYPMDDQAPLSMRFSQWKYWSGLPFPSPTLILHVGKSGLRGG